MGDGNRTGRTVVPDSVISAPTSENAAGLDQILEVVADGPAPAAPHAFLLVTSGAEPGRLFALDEPELVIGRSKYADIRVSERALSQQHAKLVRHGDHHRLYDLGSTNGTFVNQVRVEQADLSPGDVVRAGQTVFTYMSASGEEGDHQDSTLALPHRGQHGPPQVTSLAPRLPFSRPRTGVPLPQIVEIPPPPGPDGDGPDPLLYLLMALDFLRRYWISLSLLTILLGGLGAASYKVSKPPAVASADVELVGGARDNPVEGNMRRNFEFFRSAREAFTRAGLIQETLAELGETDVTPAMVRGVQSSLSLERAGGTRSIYRASYSASSGQWALDFLRAHLDKYVEAEIDRALEVLILEVGTLQTRLREVDQELNATEQAILAFKEEHGEGLPDQAQQLYSGLIELGASQGAAKGLVAAAATQVQISRNALASEAPLIERRIAMARPYEDNIANVRTQIAAAKSSGKGDQHPDVLALQAQLIQLEALRDQVVEHDQMKILREKNPIYEQARRELANAEAAYKTAESELARLTNDLKRSERIVAELPRLQQEYAELTRSYEASRQLHDKLFQELNNSSIQLEMERASAAARYDVISPPNVQNVSAMKTILKRAIMGAALGFFLALGLGVLRDLRRMVSARLAAMRRR